MKIDIFCHIVPQTYYDRMLKLPESDMFRAELEMFAESCRTGKANELSAQNGNVAVAMVYAALKSLEQNGQCVSIASILKDAQSKVTE